MAPGTDEVTATGVADLLKVVANPNRLRILYLLTQGECSVSEIEQRLGIRQPTLSQQLGELRNAQVVATRREHKVVFYSLTDPRMRALLDAFDDILIAGRIQRRLPSRGPDARARALGQAAMFGRVEDRS
ncbi:helix-turn-helix transcriptional regulator [Methylobacterium sp. NEAU K]|uniref:ArsR/SmtB family transcription factor n=1 Tax=Methylobacterium sp. NEAU K TaxID=3064946 RepID=UPI002732430D|nr:metalloregulator ArsR/SmtB family transcription factor [Methylobacterium sp. NEAU K]MDP4002688.1 metalloregulator ArsR/SmtB family transcription factor [Methylobacterium sp. NEAU K]